MNRKRKKLLIALGLGLLALLAVWWFLARPADVELVDATRRDVVDLVIASGEFRAKRQSDIGTEVAGVVAEVLVDEGDEASVGQLLLTLEREDIDRQIAQALRAVETARSRLAVAARGPQIEEIERARAELRRAREANPKKLEAARKRLERLELGGREAERKKAKAALDEAIAARKQAQIDVERAKQLVSQGAISQAEYDRAKTTLARAEAAETAAQEQLRLAEKPASDEEIEAARAEVEALESDTRESIRIAKESLDQLLGLPRSEDVELARSQLEEAKAQVAALEEQAAKRTVRSPISGVVVYRGVEPGQSVVLGETLLTIADMSRTEILIETDEDNLPKLRVGQSAIAVAPAYPKRPFRARVFEIGPAVESARGVVPVKLRPVTVPGFLRPDITVDVNIEVAKYPGAITVPARSVVERGGETVVFTVRDRRARPVGVEVLGRSEDWAAVRGIEAGTQVVGEPDRLEANQRVRTARR